MNKSTKPSKVRRGRQPLTDVDRAARKAKRLQSVQRLLYSREQTAEVLGGVCVMTVIRLENAGRLRKVRLGRPVRDKAGKEKGKVYNLVEEVHALVQGRLGDG